MGATNIHYEHPQVDARGKEISAKEAFNNLYEEALEFSGSDPYSGTISTCVLAGSIRAPKDDDDDYYDLLDRIGKREVRYYKEGNNWVFIGWAAC